MNKETYELKLKYAVKALMEFKDENKEVLDKLDELSYEVEVLNNEIANEKWMEGHCYKLTSKYNNNIFYIHVKESTYNTLSGEWMRIVSDDDASVTWFSCRNKYGHLKKYSNLDIEEITIDEFGELWNNKYKSLPEIEDSLDKDAWYAKHRI